MRTTLTIAGTPHDGPARADAGISDLGFEWDLESPWTVTFSVTRTCNSYPPFVPGTEVTLTTADDDGTDPVLRFVGDLQRPQSSLVAEGIRWDYAATDLKRRADYVTLTGLDGSGTASFNLAPDDYLYLWNTSGLTVGDICVAILQQADNAAALAGLGVGNYASLSPPTLPADTLTDLAALMVVPPEAVQLGGECLLNILEQFILRWHCQYVLFVLPDGTIRVRSIFALDPATVALPVGDGSGDDCDWPEIVGPDVTDCFTAWEIRGLDIQTATLSTKDDTLRKAWTDPREAAYTIADFLQPKDSSDQGDVSTVTSVSCVVASDYASAHWITNFWNGPDVGGWVYLYDPVAIGLDIYEIRQITSCTALTPGGTATITWSSGQPINSTGYSRYRIVGLNSPMALVGREFHVRQPGKSDSPPGNNLDRNSWVGSHFEPRNPKGAPVANSSRSFPVFYPYAFVRWSRTGEWPWFEEPVPVQLNPLTGRIILTQPAVMKSCALAGTTSILSDHYPTTYQEGLYADLQVLVPFNRGALVARAPELGSDDMEPPTWLPESWLPEGWLPGASSDFSGTAFTQFGIRRVKTQYLPGFTWQGDTASLKQLAAEHLACVRDAVISGSLRWYELPTSFDALTPGFCLRVSAAGSTTPMDGLDLPVRSASIRWHDDGPMLYSAEMRFSNLRRPFQGDDLYIHPALGVQSFGTQEGDVMGYEGAAMAQGMASSMGQGRLSGAIPMGEDMSQSQLNQSSDRLEHAMPVGQDAGDNPIANSLAGGDLPDMPDMDPSSLAGPLGGGGKQRPEQRAADERHRDREKKAEEHAKQARARGPEAQTGKAKEAREKRDADFAKKMHAQSPEAQTGRNREKRKKDDAANTREARQDRIAGREHFDKGSGDEGSWQNQMGEGDEGSWGEEFGEGDEGDWGDPPDEAAGHEGGWG